MGRTYDQLDERLRRWIAGQRMFFVATAPSGPGGHGIDMAPHLVAPLAGTDRAREVKRGIQYGPQPPI
jgi:hypothetical protein